MSWKEFRLKDIGEIVTGNTPSRKLSEYYGGNIPWIKPADLNKEVYLFSSQETISELGKSKVRLVPKDSILVSCIGDIGKVAISGCELCTNQQINSIIPNMDIIVPKFLYYLIINLNFYLKNISNNAVVPLLNKGDFSNIIIKIPPISTQNKIVEKLDNVEILLKYRNKSLNLFNSYLYSLFNHMFLNKEFKKDTLKNYTSLITSGSTPKGGSENYTKEGDILFIRSQNVLMNEFSQHDSLYISSEIHNNMKRTWIKNKDVLLNITGASIGRTVVYTGPDDKANLNQHVCIIRLKDFNIINPIFLNYYLASDVIQKHIKQVNAGATREALNFTQIGKFKILIPPIELQNQFAEIVKQVEEIKKYQLESKKELENLFNNLMQKAFKWELIC